MRFLSLGSSTPYQLSKRAAVRGRPRPRLRGLLSPSSIVVVATGLDKSAIPLLHANLGVLSTGKRLLKW